MQTASQYFARTESAVRHLFNGIDSYLDVLREIRDVTFVSGRLPGPELDAEFAAWRAARAPQLAAAMAAQQRFTAESFALDCLCGSVLQIAGKALDMYSTNASIPNDWSGVIKPDTARYCIGRNIRTVPIGLAIYAARNQHTHFNDDKLREPSATILKRVAQGHGFTSDEPFADPAFDLGNPRILSLATNVTALLGWRSFDRYDVDMRGLLVDSEGDRTRHSARHCGRRLPCRPTNKDSVQSIA